MAGKERESSPQRLKQAKRALSWRNPMSRARGRKSRISWRLKSLPRKRILQFFSRMIFCNELLMTIILFQLRNHDKNSRKCFTKNRRIVCKKNVVTVRIVGFIKFLIWWSKYTYFSLFKTLHSKDPEIFLTQTLVK